MAVRVRVLVADPQPVFRDGLARGIREARPDLELVAVASDGPEALQAIRTLRPDVAVIEYDLPPLGGAPLLASLERDDLATRLLFLSARLDREDLYRAIAGGAAGYLTKAAGRDEIGDAIAAAHRGETVLSPELDAVLADGIVLRTATDAPILTARERQALDALAGGATVAGVAAELGVSRATAKAHLHRVYAKLGVAGQPAAVAAALRRGLIK